MKLAKPTNEISRIQTLESYNILDTLPEQAYDDITYLASRIFGTPISLVSLVDSERQWFKSRQGLDASETHRDYAFCDHAIRQPENVFIVPDTHQDKRFSDNVLVTGAPFIRFYAGAPLITPSGNVLGTLCVIDREPRALSTAEEKTLSSLARLVMTQLQLRMSLIEAEKNIETQKKLEATIRESEERFQAFMANTPAVTFIKNNEGKYTFVNKKFFNVFNKTLGEVIGKTDQELWPSETADKFRENDKLILTNQIPMNFEETTTNNDGSASYWLSCKFPLHDSENNELLAGISFDITDRFMKFRCSNINIVLKPPLLN
jgi:PAS domain S-box-containing protein